MKGFSNTYIFIFSAIMVIFVAALLSAVAISLKPQQDLNEKIETMKNILTSVQVESSKNNTGELFKKYITESYVITPDAVKTDDLAFDVDMKKEVALIDKIKKLKLSVQERRVSPFKQFMRRFTSGKKINKRAIQDKIAAETAKRKLPVYVCKKEGNTYYILPVRGKGLWGPVWGYIALESDLNTVYGAVFDHKSETPGLGAEIVEPWFQADFPGKKIYSKDAEFKSVEVKKGGADPSDLHAVDAISGGTITSKGVEDMLYDCLLSYETFFANQRTQ